MTKIQQTSLKKQIISNNFCADSFKLSIDTDKLKSVNIPESFILVSEDTGEEIERFKKKSIRIKYKNTTIYLGVFRRKLREIVYDKVVILFSSKVANAEYFCGIKKHHVFEVLEYIKKFGYIDYTDVSEIYKNLYTTDCDIKIDFLFDKIDRDKIVIYNKELKKRFQFEDNECHAYNSSTNLGLQTFNRDRSTLSKPFVKWYDKSRELTAKHLDFFKSLPEDIRDVLVNKFIYRFEFTMKDKKFFAKFGLSNRLEDVLEVTNDKWREVSINLLNVLFQYKVKRLRNTNKLNYYEKILALYLFEVIQKKGASVSEAKRMYTSVQKSKQQKWKASLLFDKVYNSITTGEARDIHCEYENIERFDKIFGIVS